MSSARAAKRTTAKALFSAVLVVLLFAVVFPAPVMAASGCQFVFGFKTLHDRIPSVVGNCVANETYNVNGDGIQRTTNGTLVWRKADNHTAFTNGYQTWVLGPFGLQTRLNNARFSWEPDVAPSDVDPRFSESYHLAASSKLGDLVSAVVHAGVPVRPADLKGGWGVFIPNAGHPVILINAALLGTDPNDAAAVLVHEATHYQQLLQEPNFGHSQAGCIHDEFDATVNGLVFWRDHFGPGGKQPPTDRFEQQINGELALAENNLKDLLAETLIAYQRECQT